MTDPINGASISVVDDDESVRESLAGCLTTLGYVVNLFASAESFLSSDALPNTQCLILDVCMPGMTGGELQDELIGRGEKLPIIFITAREDEVLIARLKASGAVECLLKPFEEGALLKAISKALAG